MTIVRINSRKGVLNIQDEMNRLFNAYYSKADSAEVESKSQWFPRVDISESEEAILVYVEIPGMKKDTITLYIQDNILTLSGEKMRDADSEKVKYFRVEREYGKFERKFSLPKSVNSEKVKAQYTDGVLRIILPKSPEKKPRVISVGVS